MESYRSQGMDRAAVELFHHRSCSKYWGPPHGHSLQDWKCCLLMGHSWISANVLRQRELLVQSYSSSPGTAFQWLLHARVQSNPLPPTSWMQWRVLLKSYSSFRSPRGIGWEFCCSYIAGQFFALPCPASFNLWKGLILKHSPILLGLSLLQNQAIDWWCPDHPEEAVSKNGTLEMNYS